MSTAVNDRVRLLAVLCFLLFYTACTPFQNKPRYSADLPVERRQELTGTPFFPQDDYQCGPASLAMALNSRGVDVSPEQLQPLVYLPGKKGSLQAEMLAAAGHFGQMAVRLRPSLDDLLLELHSGHPVIVLQNLGRAWFPVWHYAVAIGYNLDKEQIYLRSGRDERRRYSFAAFEKTWERSGHWAMVVVSPGTVPAAVDRPDYLKAASALERRQAYAAALAAYRAGTRRWPDSGLAWAGSGNAAYALSRFGEAEHAYREALRLDPESASVMNNLAMALLKQGCKQEAMAAIDCALRYRPDDPNLAATRGEINEIGSRTDRCEGFVCAAVR